LQNGSPENELLGIYPNPASDHAIIRINAGEAGPATLDMYDVSGKFIRSYSIVLDENNPTKFVLNNIWHLAGGVYLLHLQTPYSEQTGLLFVN